MSLEGNIAVTNANFVTCTSAMDEGKQPEELSQQEFHKLRQQHEINKQALMAHFQYQTSSLQQQHQHQLQEHFKMFLSQQKEAANQADELINSIKNKEKTKESAVASIAVKKHLQKFVIGRQKVKIMDRYPGNLLDRPKGLHWAPSLDETEGGSEVVYPAAMLDKYDDFPLRKTASEPNLKVRSRLKQKLSMDQRSSPLLIRRNDVKADLANKIKRKINSEFVGQSQAADSCKSAPNSTPGSPPNADIPVLSTVPHKDAEFCDFNLHKASGVSSDLYTSPSLPNLSLSAQKAMETGAFVLRDHELSKLVSRTSSLPGPLVQLSNKPYSPPGAANVASKVSSPPGPIRSSHLTRPHKTLFRTHSAPTYATSQLQQHILQRKQAKFLQQQQKMLQKYRLAASPELAHLYPNLLPTHLEADDKAESYVKQYQGYSSLISGRFPDLKEEKSSIEDVNYSRNHRLQPSHSVSQAKRLAAPGGLPATLHEDRNQNASVHQNTLEPKLIPRVADLSHKPLLRTHSSPASSFIKKGFIHEKYRYTTGIAYSPVMLKHGCACGDDHVENSGRLQAIWDRLTKCDLVSNMPNSNSMCELIKARKATTDELQLVHTQEHTLKYGTTSLARKELALHSKFVVLPCGGVGVDNGIDIDTVWNELDTINAARMAVGCTVDLSLLVAQGQLKNGFALVRPPGHHAEKNLAMAFCYFNSVAVATRKLQCASAMRKILIVDWDIHHCNGTQNIFYDDPSVLVISLHRYDDRSFFPGTGAIHEVGSKHGIGYNINIPFSGGLDPPIGDAEYLTVFRTVVLPIAQQFDPDFILISSGFAAAKGHSSNLGGYYVSPLCFGYMTRMLMQLANGKVVMVLEGGFELKPLCDCAEACIRTLLGDTTYTILPEASITQKPDKRAVDAINSVINIQAKYWKKLDAGLAFVSHQEWIALSREHETCKAMASLSVQNTRNASSQEKSWSPGQSLDLSTNHKHASVTSKNGNSKGIFRNSPILEEKSLTDVTMSPESSPVDVVGTSAPSSPLLLPNNDDKSVTVENMNEDS